MPVYQQCRLEFFLKEEFVGLNDYQFEEAFGKDFPDYSKLNKEEKDELLDYGVNSIDSRIGGYASFTQLDVRVAAPPNENWLLLLQIASAKNARIGWGDGGVGSFFIEEKALKALDFSKVLYNWNC